MLSIAGLHAHYAASHVLQGVDLDVQRGRIVAMLGRNGVGKTTTLRSLMGLVPPSAGRILLDGVDIAGWPPHRVARAGVAYVPEGRLIFPDLTVIENIRVAERRPAQSWPLPRLLELFPSLAERARHRGGNLSGGEQQMLAIARALLSRPRLLLLDEPSLGLAPKTSDFVFGLIAELRREGLTVLLVEQKARQTLKFADRAYLLEGGRVIASGAAVGLANDSRVAAAFLGEASAALPASPSPTIAQRETHQHG